MPHSSGGGSHGGGFHGGGGSHGRSGGGGIRVSRKCFPGSRRYMYYSRGVPHYFYSSTPVPQQTVAALILQLVFIVPFLLLGVFMLVMGFSLMMPPQPLTQTAAYEQYHIEDTLDVIDNESELESVLQQFQSTTGICPYIVTVDTGIWKNKFSSLEDYAYDTYLRKFSDEQHFLIVYSAPVKTDPANAVNWKWEGMQGNDTDPILTERNMEKFNRRLYNSLEGGMSAGKAMHTAFEESLDYMMEAGGNIVDGVMCIGFAILWLGMMCVVMVQTIQNFILGRKQPVEVPMEDETRIADSSFLDV